MTRTEHTYFALACATWLAAAGGCTSDPQTDSLDEVTGSTQQELAYGTWGTFAAYGGRCLDLASGNTHGGNVQIYDCNGASNQLWTFSNPRGPVFNGAAFSAGMQERSNQLNVVVNPWTANVSSSLWTMPTGLFVSYAGGYCMSTDSFGRLMLDFCGVTNSYWTFDHVDRVGQRRHPLALHRRREPAVGVQLQQHDPPGGALPRRSRRQRRTRRRASAVRL